MSSFNRSSIHFDLNLNGNVFSNALCRETMKRCKTVNNALIKRYHHFKIKQYLPGSSSHRRGKDVKNKKTFLRLTLKRVGFSLTLNGKSEQHDSRAREKKGEVNGKTSTQNGYFIGGNIRNIMGKMG